ncbi:MAG: preprotein translocase subunit YajC [Deltaproteobacteria bacterium RIFCSPLOWO2_02_FULL_50_16]|nr:MAG: preprotein translocase subunit YajC [Deltaproteobacteria bacterium RIFCSPHIGHO2_02_FULL_50_15]OGQ58321.1 MAG: preprotein translocase subunit YajC [Deltaproteobacteria bacterium RIFCSPLOWO2_02_FULL_50_16]OGQ66650.1 MAG: preprotein translocase subunit YajC [Deltaproteobacteria bacterium RIFCSPLOWO2_12_FULL_50_11]
MARSPVNGEGQPSPGGGAGLFLPMILVFVIFYFLLIRPQSKQQKKHREMLGHVKKDDQVITNSGIHGQVVGLTDNVITLEIANNVRIKIEKTAISQVKNLAAVQQKT